MRWSIKLVALKGSSSGTEEGDDVAATLEGEGSSPSILLLAAAAGPVVVGMIWMTPS